MQKYATVVKKSRETPAMSSVQVKSIVFGPSEINSPHAPLAKTVSNNSNHCYCRVF